MLPILKTIIASYTWILTYPCYESQSSFLPRSWIMLMIIMSVDGAMKMMVADILENISVGTSEHYKR